MHVHVRGPARRPGERLALHKRQGLQALHRRLSPIAILGQRPVETEMARLAVGLRPACGSPEAGPTAWIMTAERLHQPYGPACRGSMRLRICQLRDPSAHCP